MKIYALAFIGYVFVFSAQESMAEINANIMPAVLNLLLDEAPTFVEIHPLLKDDCSGCHAVGTGGYTANADPSHSFNSALTKIDLETPELSHLLRKPASIISHGGGQISGYAPGEAKYNLILGWINGGAPFE